MKIYNIINIPKGLSPEFECDCQDEYNSGYTAGLEEGYDKGYDSGYTDGAESVDCEDFYDSGYTDGYESGYTSGYTDGQASVDCTDFYNSGVTDGYASGYTSGRTDGYDDGWQPGYDSGRTDGEEAGYEEGKEYQKTLLVSTAITANGTYEREDGFSAVTVDVPQTGQTINNQDKEVFLDNPTFGIVVDSGRKTGWYTQEVFVRADSGYTGLGTVSAYTTFEPTEAISFGEERQKEKLISETFSANGTYDRVDGWERVVVSVPPCQGYEEGYADGEAAQKAKLKPSAFRENGTYFREDGYSQVIVNVPDRYDEGYNSGYTDGYSSGRTDGYDDGWRPGYASGYTSGKTDGFGEGYDSGFTDGVASVDCQPLYDSGYTDGYESGHTDGYDERAAMMTAMTITANGSYESIEGWSAVTVNVSGYSQEDLDNAYASGHTSGVTDGAAQQKALLTSTAFTANGTYTRENGWSAVTVNVAQTGYTQQDLDNAYASGLTNGYDSGWTAGYDSGYTDGLDACGTDFAKKYLTIEALSAGTLYWRTGSSAFTKTIEWSKDEGQSWSSVTSSDIDSGTVITIVQPGDIVMFKGNNSWYCDTLRQTHFLADFDFIVYGNIMSLVESDNFVSLYDFTSVHALCGLFEQNPHLLSAENLILPATGLTEACYEKMFENCTSLTAAPALPATRLADSCYLNMFANCTSLVNAPSLPATTLAHRCYLGMFQYNETLSGTPELPADFIEDESYALMFFNCSNLQYVKCLATGMATPPSGHYYPTYNWLKNVSGTGTFVKDANASWTTGDNGIPTGWNTQDV